MSRDNAMHIILTNAIGAMDGINIALARLPDGLVDSKKALLESLHSNLIIAEQVRQHFEEVYGNVRKAD